MMETVILRLAGLFFLVVAVAPWAVAYRLSLPSSSSGSASGDLVQGELECNCKVPPYSNPSGVRVNPTNEEWEELMLEGPCYLACAKKYQNYVDEIRHLTISVYWPFLMNVNESDCTILGKIHECVRGCVVRTRTSRRSCRNTCISSCTDECDGQTKCVNPDLRDPWNHPQCSVTCEYHNRQDDENACTIGCTLDRTSNTHPTINRVEEGVFPHDPIGPPLLTPVTNTERAGLFTVDLSDAAPQPMEGSGGRDSMISPTQSPIPPVVFLFKIEERNSHNISYIWMSNPLANLDLIDYACQDLTVSFAVANSEAGLSNFSLTTNMTVDIRVGGFIPNPPTNLQVLDEIDTRIGFFGHVILNISWERPLNDAYLENFTVTISPTMDDTSTVLVCGSDSLNVTVSLNDTCIIVEADAPFSLPLMNCFYTIKVYSVGFDGCSEPLTSDEPYEIEAVLNLNGTRITFQCDNGSQALLTTTCCANGDWSPSPSELDCNPSDNTRRGNVLSTSSQVILAAVICSFTFFLFGILVGALCHRWATVFIKPRNIKHSWTNETIHEHPHTDTPAAGSPVVYEEVTSVSPSGQKIELKENVAYGPI